MTKYRITDQNIQQADGNDLKPRGGTASERTFFGVDTGGRVVRSHRTRISTAHTATQADGEYRAMNEPCEDTFSCVGR